ncbi:MULTISPECIES: major capsid protein [Burkholderia cepacia complex]|uniref:major capsid protein n=1 Tax=Burkholderia cepacia complex TaxID=87882 RepID=UPI000BA7B213|nr:MULTISPECIES: hypothetical protein [Burkholderia cepacia complex]PAK14349.1 hypothetical protein CJO66_13610 [Burkholderia ubonensis]RQQ00151.1 hypothetical protein DF009_01900 [Burkholderia ubonensis]RQQ49134.1 hypothetical protein DF145_16095 [Burkholderia stagnalis]RQY00131.1 hypothetical protein DF121_16375 [Burkholderia stagnalis]RQY14513.1 hypothetical protein DF115_19190 [Burkholderia stagnalis]
MGRLSKLRIVDPVLTGLAIGYTNAEFIGQNLMPIVEVEKEGGQIPKFGKEAFRLYNTERGLRAASNRINPDDPDTVAVNLDEHDIEFPIDYREEQESAFPIEQAAVNTTTEALQLRREKKIADIAQSPASYSDGNKKALSAAEKFTADGSDPIGVIEDGKEAIRTKIGRRPNTMVIGASAYKTLKHHPQLIDKIKYSMKGIVTADLLKEIFEVDNIVVGEAIYADDRDRFRDIWGANIVLAYVPLQRNGQQRTPYEPSYGYTLRKKGNPVVDTRIESGGKLEIVRNTDIFRPYLLGSDAGYLITGVNG